MRMDLREMVWELVDLVHLTRDRVQWRVLVEMGNFLTSRTTTSSRATLLHGVNYLVNLFSNTLSIYYNWQYFEYAACM